MTDLSPVDRAPAHGPEREIDMTDKPYNRADVELVERAIHDVTPPIVDGYVDGRDLLNAEACAVLDALAAAGRLLPELTQASTEWGVWWHATDPDGIVMTDDQHARREQAETAAKGRIGQYGITGYTLVKCAHRRYADGSTWTSAWDRVETVMP